MSADHTEHADSSRFNSRFDPYIAVLLGLSAILVAVSGYQATLNDGDSIKAFNEANLSTSNANGFYNEAVQVNSRDQALFVQFAAATQQDDDSLATYVYEKLMDENLRVATDEWSEDETDEIASALEAPSYEVPQQAEAERLEKLAGKQFAEAKSFDKKGDDYSLVGVIVATSLFFLGIAGVMQSPRIKLAGLALGTATLVGAFGMWLTI